MFNRLQTYTSYNSRRRVEMWEYPNDSYRVVLMTPVRLGRSAKSAIWREEETYVITDFDEAEVFARGLVSVTQPDDAEV
jgi:hypothetical protein